MRKLTVILLIIFVLLILLGTVLVLRWAQDIPDALLAAAELSAGVADQGGVDPSSAFILRFSENVSSASVNRALSVSPQIELGVHQGTSRSEVLLSPAEPLQPDTVYTFTIASDSASYQWAFQTKAPLAVAETRPAAQESNVSRYAGLEIVLSQMLDVNLEQLAEAVQIRPETAGSFSQSGRVIRFVPENGWQAGTVYEVEITDIPLLASDVELTAPYSVSFETAPAEPSRWQISGDDAFIIGDMPRFQAQISDKRLFDAAEALAAAEDTSAQALALAEQKALTVKAQLFQFDTATDYADALLTVQQEKPWWSEAFATLSGGAVDHASALGTQMLRLAQQADGSFTLVWPDTLPAGCYLLRVTYLNQPRDLFFAVSELSAWLGADSKETLLWLHDTADGAPVSAQVTDQGASISARTDAEGLARLQRGDGAAVYRIEAGEKSLVLPMWQPAATDTDTFVNWRYLYTDQTAYQNGDTLHFWGLVQPRDGSALEYERMSVYIYPQHGGEAVWFDYAPLEANVFSGSIALPQLLAGSYSLQVWQSGSMLVSRSFSVDEPPAAADADAPRAGRPRLLLDTDDGYRLGGSFAASFQQATGNCLFIESAGGALRATAGNNNLYLGVFTPENMLNSYITAVGFDGRGYVESAPALLRRDATAYTLQVTVDCASLLRVGTAQPLSVLVRDAAGAPVSGAAVAVSVFSGGALPEENPWGAIYGDFQPSGLAGQPAAAAAAPMTQSGRTLQFLTGVTDENGVYYIDDLALADAGGCYVLAQAMLSGESVLAGAAAMPFTLRGNAAAAMGNEAHAYTLESGVLAKSVQFRDDGAGSLLIVSGASRLQWLSRLLETAVAATDDAAGGDVALQIAASAACSILQDMLGDDLTALAAAQPVITGQAVNGSLSGLALDVFAAALNAPGVSQAGLRSSFAAALANDADSLALAQALVGRAACGDTVLNELKLLLSRADRSAEEDIWLAWGLYLCGDTQNALALAARTTLPADAPASAWAVMAVLAAYQGDEAAASSALARSDAASGSLASVLVARLLLPDCAQQQVNLSYGGNDSKHTISLPANGDLLFPLASGDTLRFEPTTDGLGYCWLRAWPAGESSEETTDAAEAAPENNLR